MRHASILLVLTAILASAALAQEEGTSLEQWAATSDLVVVAKVSSVGDFQKAKVALSEGQAPQEMPLRVYETAVTELLQADSPAQQPANQPAQSAPAASAPAKGQKLTVLASESRFLLRGKQHPLDKDSSYVFFLRRVPSEAGFFLPTLRAVPADESAIKAAKAAVNVDNWPWGKESGGLKLALLINSEFNWPGGGAAPPDGIVKANISPACSLAMRNVSQKPIAINLYLEDRYLSMKASGGEEKETPIILYHDLPPNAGITAPFNEAFTTIIQPGQVILIGPWGPASQWQFPLSLGLAQWKLQAGYFSKRSDKGVKGMALWQGTVQAAPVQIEIKQGGNPLLPPPP